MPRFRRPSPALVIACVALFVAMGGTGYAALKLPKNSVKAKQLAPRSVSSSEAHNLAAKDFKKSARAKLRGPTGPRGPAGPAGSGGGAEALRVVGPQSLDGNCDTISPPPQGEFCYGENGSSWQNFGSGYAPAGFYRDGSGRVHLQGSVSGDVVEAAFPQEVVFYLPAGYRPAQNRRFAASLNGAAGWVDVRTDGAVAPSQATATLLSLDGISFRP